ncbi:gamma-aminobutyraldehyde dehydrogenase [Mangrovactinospora gilvigrisea]|uniref:Gamma-aminobutyraldehyde dehydrogenase n=1 Tax=Mangrovactinospora gilvigrisea TaxID=1428644 RepID=A0A1J7BPT3_9ACTN|nr:aminobutyraldehyde dehydrogenase [Mangrovactinospora gilvigrisea]OIV35457.1 gamma-aminobutyraldehyde dehydrogenase [Mangrovactinospora gilvigrisea]
MTDSAAPDTSAVYGRHRGGQWINGAPAAGRGGAAAVTDPATGAVLAGIALASPADVDAAVAAAKAAFPGWSAAAPVERAEAVARLAAELGARAEELALVESEQAGKPIRLCREFDVPGTVDNAAFFAGAARQLEGKAAGEYSADHTSMIRRDPIGVVGSIAPWNYPLQMAGWKILPAVAAGNTVVLKPSELTPFTALMLAEAARAAGVPDGVVNIVTGAGPVAGEHLVAHPDVAMTSFTGSTAVGRRIAELAAAGPKRTHLELGGKAPFVVHDDADLDAAVRGAAAGALINTGQDCTAATRAYVQRPLYEAFVAKAAAAFDAVRLGDPRNEGTDLGPLVSHRQAERVAGFVERARGRGAVIAAGGGAPKTGWDGTDLARGAYYRPTLVTGLPQDDELVRQEVFGPVLVVLPFDTDEEGIRLANDTPYGLAASVWTGGIHRALRATREIQAGCVWVNDHIPIISEMPHGGWKASGHGKDMSAYSLEDYTQVKHVMFDLTGAVAKDWQSTVLSAADEEG